MLGDRFDAGRALDLGLVNRVVARDLLEHDAMALATRLAAGAPEALGRTKRLISQSFDQSLEDQLLSEQKNFVDGAGEPDFAEGLTAFFEKRKPRFSQG